MPNTDSTPSLLIDAVVNSLIEYRLDILKVSRPWASRAWPNDKDPMFVNAVILAVSQVEPQLVLRYLQKIESEFGRRRSYKNAPRPLDLDLIAYDDLVISEDNLTIPHPNAHERAFVLGPLCDIDPEWLHPVVGIRASALYGAATIGRDAYPLLEDVWPTL